MRGFINVCSDVYKGIFVKESFQFLPGHLLHQKHVNFKIIPKNSKTSGIVETTDSRELPDVPD